MKVFPHNITKSRKNSRNSGSNSRKNSRNSRRNNKTKKLSNNRIRLQNITCDSIEQKLSVNQTNKVLQELGKGASGIAFKGCLDLPECTHGVSIKYISIVKKHKYSNDENDPKHPANIEYNLGKSLSKLVEENKTPHINITIHNFKCNLSNLTKIQHQTFSQPKATEWLQLTQRKLDNNVIFERINVIFNELADMDLQTYILNHSKKLTHQDHLILLFQLCYTLTCIQFEYRNFRHNDIKPNNLLVEIDRYVKHKNNNYIAYKIFGKTFYLPQTRYIMKLYDFDFGYSDQFQNYKITTPSPFFNQKGYTPQTNCLYDLHSYINFYYFKFKHILSDETKSLLKSLVPTDDNIVNKNYTNKNYMMQNNSNKGLENTLLGKFTDYTNKYKLTSFRMDGKFNYVPKKMYSCADLLCYHPTIFKQFEAPLPPNARIIHTYESNISLTPETEKRRDMFNIKVNN